MDHVNGKETGNYDSSSLSGSVNGIPYRAAYDFSSPAAGDLEMREGDIVEVTDRTDDWWIAVHNGKSGVVPYNYLEPLSGPLEYFGPLLPAPSAPTIASALSESIRVLPAQARALRDVNGGPGELSFCIGDIIDIELRNTAEVWFGRVGGKEGTFHLDDSVEPVLKERVRALWNFDPVSPEDLRFNAGDIIQVVGPSSASTWWWHGWIPGKGIGTFPYNFVESIQNEYDDSDDEDCGNINNPVPKCLVRLRALQDVYSVEEGMLSFKKGEIIDLVERQSTEKWLGRVRGQVGTFLLDDNIEPIMTDQVKALFDFTPTIVEELEFKANDIITVVGPSDESTFWWYGSLNGRLGMFPFNFVDLIPDEKSSKNDSDEWVDIPADQPATVRALHNYSSGDKEELSFDCGDIITVIDSNSHPEHWKGELKGKVGTFPRVYCEVVARKVAELGTVALDPEPLPAIYQEPALSERWIAVEASASRLNDTLPASSPLPREHFPASPVTPKDGVYAKVDDWMKPNSEYPSSFETKNLLVRGLWDFESDDPGDLTFHTGEIIEVLDQPTSTMWWRGRLGDRVGIFPCNYVNTNYEQEKGSNDPLIPRPKLSTILEMATPKTSLSSVTLSSSPSLLSPTDSSKASRTNLISNTKLPWTPCFARALYNFDAAEVGELAFQRGDILEITSMKYDTWWEAKLRMETGIVPSNYLELIDLGGLAKEKAEEPPKLNPIRQQSLPPREETEFPTKKAQPAVAKRRRAIETYALDARRVVALHPWRSDRPEEISFDAGDIIEVLKRPVKHWWKGKLEKNGNVGLFPANFVDPIEDNKQPAQQPPVEDTPPPYEARRKSTIEDDEAVIKLRANIGQLHPLLAAFDTENNDLVDNAQIQELYRSSCIWRRRVLRLLEEQPSSDALLVLEESWQEIKDAYDEIMVLSATRHLQESATRRPNLPTAYSENRYARTFSGASFTSEPESDLPTSTQAFPPTSLPNPPSSVTERRGTGGSVTGKMSLPPTPAVNSNSHRTSYPFPPNSSGTSSTPRTSWSANLAAIGQSRGRGYDGRLSVIEADIQRAMAAYVEPRRGSEPRQLPPSPAARGLTRGRKRGSGDSTQFKSIFRRPVEYQYYHVVEHTQHRRRD